MNVFLFNKILYKGSVNKDFYLFCLKENKKLLKYLFIDLFYFLVSLFFVSKKNLYLRKKFKYLSEVKDLNTKVADFYKENNKINNFFDDKIDYIIDSLPKILIPNGLSKKVVGFELNEKYEPDIDDYEEKIKKIKKCNILFIRNEEDLIEVQSNKIVVVNKNKYKLLLQRKKKNVIINNLCALIFISLFLTCISFLFATCPLNLRIFVTFFEPKLFLLNFFPIFILVCFLFFLFKNISLSYFIISTLIIVLGIANQTKLVYRDDIVKFQDILLFKEAMIMSERYDIVIKKYTIISIILTFIFTIILKNIFKKAKIKRWLQLISLFVIFCVMILSYNCIYKNKKIYDSVGKTGIVNVYIGTRNYQIRGLIYPFIYTLEDGFYKAPDGYNKKEVENVLNSYNYENIPNDKKINIIAIMLEAYNDFSKFKEISFTEDIYSDFHQIQKNSIHGNLVTTIFGGGTIMTERYFLTGYYNLFDFRKKTNSYIWYFKEQGYRTEAMHPIYGAFYNRASYNPNLGFDVYYNYENKFSNIQYDFMDDEEFFKYIIEGYEESKKDNIPYFNFSVTYQNHGPYSSTSNDDKEYYIKKNNMSDEAYNIINKYFSGIKKTNSALKQLIDYFDNEKEPVIVILFGDHNPYLGVDAQAYNELGINLNLSSIEGFENYYQTPYVIHANSSAKKQLSNKFIGKADDISPIFLMNEVFNNIGIKGNQYLQYMNDLKSKIDVITEYYLKEDGEYIKRNLSKYSKSLDLYEKINFYYSKNYIFNLN